MSLTTDLAKLEQWLRQRSPTTWASLRPPATLDAIDSTAHQIGVRILPDLKRLWRWHDGSEGALVAGVPLQPGHYLLGVNGALVEWHGRTDVAGYSGDSRSWSPQWLPITSDGAGNHFVVDHRPGPELGSVFVADLQNGPMRHRGWPSLADLVRDLCDALTHGRPVDGHLPHITEEGRLAWTFSPA
ncbi:SMI1/KNR4 family protein [Micromonospora vinacea]|uniref:SMI1/KNR4 family protein n=1 Tax=Micromonospora vinacea TaxID=709878 RepID=UPI003D926FBA